MPISIPISILISISISIPISILISISISISTSISISGDLLPDGAEPDQQGHLAARRQRHDARPDRLLGAGADVPDQAAEARREAVGGEQNFELVGLISTPQKALSCNLAARAM